MDNREKQSVYNSNKDEESLLENDYANVEFVEDEEQNDKEENTIKKPKNNKRENLLLIIAIILVIGFFGAIGYVAYLKIYIPNKVIDSVNNNIDVYNSLEEKAKNALDTSSKTTQDFDFTKPETLESVKQNSQLLDSVKKDYISSENNLSKGLNADSEEFYNLTLENFKSKENVLQFTIKLNDYQVCLFDNYTKVIANNTKIQDLGTKITKATEPGLKSDLRSQFTKEAVTASETIKGIEKCYTNEFKEYQTQEVKDILTKSTQYYQDLAQGKEVSGLPAIFDSKNSSLLVDGPLQTLANKNIDLKKLDDRLQVKLDEVKNKYKK